MGTSTLCLQQSSLCLVTLPFRVGYCIFKESAQKLKPQVPGGRTHKAALHKEPLSPQPLAGACVMCGRGCSSESISSLLVPSAPTWLEQGQPESGHRVSYCPNGFVTCASSPPAAAFLPLLRTPLPGRGEGMQGCAGT